MGFRAVRFRAHASGERMLYVGVFWLLMTIGPLSVLTRNLMNPSDHRSIYYRLVIY